MGLIRNQIYREEWKNSGTDSENDESMDKWERIYEIKELKGIKDCDFLTLTCFYIVHICLYIKMSNILKILKGMKFWKWDWTTT